MRAFLKASLFAFGAISGLLALTASPASAVPRCDDDPNTPQPACLEDMPTDTPTTTTTTAPKPTTTTTAPPPPPTAPPTTAAPAPAPRTAPPIVTQRAPIPAPAPAPAPTPAPAPPAPPTTVAPPPPQVVVLSAVADGIALPERDSGNACPELTARGNADPERSGLNLGRFALLAAALGAGAFALGRRSARPGETDETDSEPTGAEPIEEPAPATA